MKPILCLVAVGEEYNKYIPSSIEKLSKKYDLCILTDRPIRLFGVLDQEIYLETIFTYFAKLTFSIRMALKHKRGVYYCDINKLHELDNLDVTDKYKFTYIQKKAIMRNVYNLRREINLVAWEITLVHINIIL